MALFGSFETEREVYSDPIYTVYSARKAGDAKAEYALKVFSMQRVEFESDTATELAPLLMDIESSRINCVEVQAKGSAASKFIAPVLERGQDERGVWYVTHFYPRSVNKLIIGKVVLSREALRLLIRSIAQGALDFKRSCGRSHGDILPSNVQIGRSERLEGAQIVLCDPMPGGDEEAVTFELNDLRSIGRILLQLVRQRPIGTEEEFLILPILSSEEWTTLFGKDSEAWLSICNRLLDPNLLLEQFSLERLIAELDQLAPKAAVSPKYFIAAAAGVVVTLLILVLLLRPRAQEIAVTSDPPGATILLEKKDQGRVTPLKLKLKKGTYLLEAQHASLGLQALATNLTVRGGGSRDLHFQFLYGSVVIKSDPPGATIRSQGAVIGKTPADPGGFVIPVVPAGTEVKYELSLPGRATKTVSGIVTSGQRLILSETLPLSKDVGTLDLDSTRRGARVFWKDKLLISSTPGQAQLEQGNYVLRTIYKVWQEEQVTVHVKSGNLVPANFYFENGLVSVDSDPSGATVLIGTNNLGTTPLRVRRTVGDTTFSFDLTGFEPNNVSVKVVDKSKPSISPVLVSDNGLFELSSGRPENWSLDKIPVDARLDLGSHNIINQTLCPYGGNVLICAVAVSTKL